MRNVAIFLSLATGLAAAVLGFSPSLAADLPSTKSAPSLLLPASSNWSGVYAGGSIGYAWDSNPNMALQAYQTGFSALGAPVFAPFGYLSGANATLNNSGPVASGFVGINQQFGSWVPGVEIGLDLPLGGNQKTVTFPTGPLQIPGVGPTVAQIGAGWSLRADLTGKLGFAITPTLLPYIGAGPALLKTSSSVLSGSAFAIANGFGAAGSTWAGWHVTAGIDWMAMPGISVRLAYDHADFGSHTVAGAGLAYGSTPAAISWLQTQYLGQKRFAEEKVSLGVTFHTNLLSGSNGAPLFAPTGNVAADVATLNAKAQSTLATINGLVTSNLNPTAQVSAIKAQLSAAGLPN
jgi:opacity protein-like surface antigen